MKPTIITTLAVTLLAAAPFARALTVNGSVGGAPTGANYLNFDDLSNGDTGTLTTVGPDGPITVDTFGNAKVVTGSVGGEYAAPYLSGDNGDGFDSQTTAGADATPYLTTGRTLDGGAIRITFLNDQRYLGLLWGSIDNYNTLQFFNEADDLVGTVTGVDVINSPTGDQGVNGTLYVNIDDVTPFRYVVMTSGNFAFEFDNIAYNDVPMSDNPVPMPEGGSVTATFAATLAGLGLFARRARR